MITNGIRISTYNFFVWGGGTNIQSIAEWKLKQKHKPGQLSDQHPCSIWHTQPSWWIPRREREKQMFLLLLATSADFLDTPVSIRLCLCRHQCLPFSTALSLPVFSLLAWVKAKELLRCRNCAMILQLCIVFFFCVTLFWRSSQMKLCSNALQNFSSLLFAVLFATKN